MIVLAAVTIIFAYFIRPLLDGIVLGMVFFYVARPIRNFFIRHKCKKMAASLFSTTIIVVPIAIILVFGIIEGTNQSMWLIQNSEFIFEKITFMDRFGEIISWESFTNFMKKLPLIDYATSTVMLIVNAFISIITCYYFLKDGDKVEDAIKNLLPEDRANIVDDIDKKIEGLWIGNFYSAILISLLSLPYFLFFKIPLLALVMGLIFLAALIPIFAEWMIIAAVSIYVLNAQGLENFIIFLLIGMIFIYLLPEFLLRPYLVGKSSKTHPLLMLVSFIGGGIAFGISGFFLAPMFSCILLAIYDATSAEVEE